MGQQQAAAAARRRRRVEEEEEKEEEEEEDQGEIRLSDGQAQFVCDNNRTPEDVPSTCTNGSLRVLSFFFFFFSPLFSHSAGRQAGRQTR